MAELFPWDNSFKLWRGAPKSKYKAAIVASRQPEVTAALAVRARLAAEHAREGLADLGGGSKDWTKSGIKNLRIEVRRGSYTDWYVSLVADGKAGMSEEDVQAALYSLENGRRSYKNKRGQRIPALQGYKILARAAAA